MLYAYYDEDVKPVANDNLRLAYSNIKFENDDPLGATKRIIDTNAEIAFVSEWTGRNLDPIVILSSGYKVVIDEPKNGTHGALVLVKKNISITSRMVKNPVAGPCSIPFITVRVQYGKEHITILGVHAPPPVKACKQTTDKTVSYFASLAFKGKLAKDIGVGRKGDLVILVGDLNTLPYSTTISDISDSGLVDAHKRVGRFMGATWAPFSLLPVMARIDYVFSSPDINVQYLWNTRMPGSDHNMLVVDYK